MHILYTPFPPQVCVPLTPAQMARLDRRFAYPDRLPDDLALLVQDSAGLLGAALTVRTDHGSWSSLPEDTSSVPGLDESAWERQLGLGATSVPTCPVKDAGFLCEWQAGLIYLFCVYLFGGATLRRRLNLALFCDRMELDFLLTEHGLGVSVLRAHRLEADGFLTQWRILG